MQKSRTSCDICVNAKLGSKNAAELCDLDRVVENILTVACTELESSDKLDKLVI